MRRRAFLYGSVAILAVPLAVEAQQSITRTRIGFLGAESPSTNRHFLDAFRQGLREHGYVDGQNVSFEARWAEGRSERFPELVGELIRLKPGVILTVSVAAALACPDPERC
jgi:putative ABC transport system substrate-binding protein